MAQELAAVLYLPLVPASLKYRVYRDRIGDVSVLEWCLERFREEYPDLSLTILTHEELGFLSNVLSTWNARFVLAATRKPLGAYAEVLASNSAATLAFITLAFALAPPKILDFAKAQHRSPQRAFTVVSGLPPEVVPELVDAQLLLKVASLPFRLLPIELRAAMETLRVAASETGEAVVDFRFESLDARQAYATDPRRLPRHVRLLFPADVVALQRVESQLLPLQQDGALQRPYLWKTECIHRRNEARRRIAACVPRASSSAKPTTVLYVSYPSGFSGAEESLRQLIAGLDRSRIRPAALVGLPGHFSERLAQAGAEVHCLNTEFNVSNIESFAFVYDTLKRLRPSIVHINAPSGTPILLAAALEGCKLVVHARLAELSGLEEAICHADAVVAISRFVAAEVLTYDVREDRVHVIYNGVDSGRPHPMYGARRAIRSSLGISDSATLVLMVARFERWKRHDLLLEAVARVSGLQPPVEVLLVGEVNDPGYHDDIRAQIGSLNLTGRVRFAGFQADLGPLYAAADMLVLCSEREPFGRCVLEAMAAGLAVIVNDSGGSAEIVDHGRTGLVIQANDVEALAGAIRALASQPDERKRFGEEAQSTAARRFSMDRCAKEIMALYEDLVGEAAIVG